MNVEVQLDPFAPLTPTTPSLQELEAAWFDAPRPSLPSPRPSFSSIPAARPSAPPPPPIDDPIADHWFR